MVDGKEFLGSCLLLFQLQNARPKLLMALLFTGFNGRFAAIGTDTAPLLTEVLPIPVPVAVSKDSTAGRTLRGKLREAVRARGARMPQCGETSTADLACMQQGGDPAGAPKLRRELSSGSGASSSQLTTAPPTPRLELQLQDLMDSDEEAVTESTPTPVSVSPQRPKDSSSYPPSSGHGSGAAPSDEDTLALQNRKGRSWQGTSVLKQEELLVNLASHLDWNMVGAKCTRSALAIWWTAGRQGRWIGLGIY